MEGVYIDQEFFDKAQEYYRCNDCRFYGHHTDFPIAIDTQETILLGIKVEVMFCPQCGGEDLG